MLRRAQQANTVVLRRAQDDEIAVFRCASVNTPKRAAKDLQFAG
jgi:hypothetical protein